MVGWKDVADPKPYPREFRDDVIRVARNRDDGVTIEQIPTDFGVPPALTKWMRQADVDDGASPGIGTARGKKRGKNGKVGPPVHEDPVQQDLTAAAPNQLWLSDITEHRTREGKLYLCAIKDAFSNRIVGYCMDSRMKSRLAVTALSNAVACRGEVAGCILHADRGSPIRSRRFVRAADDAIGPCLAVGARP